MRRGWWLLLILSLGLNAGLLARTLGDWPGSAHRGWGPPDPAAGPALSGGRGDRAADRRLERLAVRIGLEPAQKERLVTIRHEAMTSLVERGNAVREARHALLATCQAVPVDTVAVQVALASLGRAQARIDSCVTFSMLRELALLSPDQRAAYLEAQPWERGRPRGLGRGGGGHP